MNNPIGQLTRVLPLTNAQRGSGATFSVDRRPEYYARVAPLIAADPLDFYTRSERGRKFQATFGDEYAREQMLDASPVEPEYEH